MTVATSVLEDLTLTVEQEVRVKASLETTFAALVEQLGPYNEKPDGDPLPMVLEPWPGGRWYRDLGNGNGHCWATVQAIKKPTLLEFAGPLMMSHPVANNVQYRLREEGGVTVIKFRHSGFGLITPEFKTGVVTGWTYIHDCVRKRAELGRSKSAVQ